MSLGIGVDFVAVNGNYCTCPVCGIIPFHDVTIYNENLHIKHLTTRPILRLAILPVLPTCNICGGEVEIRGCTKGINLIMLNGTCGSGKSAIAEELMKSHGFLAIDGDRVMQVVRHKLGVNIDYDSNEVFEEISNEIDILSAIGNNIVLTHVVLPDDIQKYKDMFETKGMIYRVILLSPRYEIAVARTQTRTCFRTVTPEEYVRYFYDKLVFDDCNAEIFDNSDITVEQSVLKILCGN